MADAATPSKGGAWTEGEKYQLLLKIIAQLTESGAKINLAKLDMPGRTPKSLSHMVGRIKAEAAQNSGDVPPGTPNSTGKRTSAAAAAAGPKGRKTPVSSKTQTDGHKADQEIDQKPFKKEYQEERDPFSDISPSKKQKTEV